MAKTSVAAKIGKTRNILVAAYLARRFRQADKRLRLLDVGGRGGIQREWALFHAFSPLEVTLVECDPSEAARLKASGYDVVSSALGDQDGTATLYITRSPGSSSLRSPNPEVVQRYGTSRFHDVVGQVTVPVRRYDTLVAEGKSRPPHFIKVDVQGYELQVLEGLGSQLDRVLCVEVEVPLVQFYEGQPTLEGVNRWLTDRGFALAELRPFGYLEGHLLEFEAFYVRQSRPMPPEDLQRVLIWEKVLSVRRAAWFVRPGWLSRRA